MLQSFCQKTSKIFFLIITYLFLSTCIFAQNSSKSNNKGQLKATFSGNVKEDKSATAIKLPKSKRKSYFSKIDSEIINLVEFGSPKSIEKAMDLLRKNESDYKENEKVLISVATQIMKIVWPSKSISWEEFEYSEITPYTEALKSVVQGVIDTSTGNVDYLSTILPALVVLMPAVSSIENIQKCEDIVNIAITNYPEYSKTVLVNYLLGIINQKKQNFAEAKKYFEVVYNLESDIFENQIAYANSLRENAEYSKAEEVLNLIDELNQNKIEVR